MLKILLVCFMLLWIVKAQSSSSSISELTSENIVPASSMIIQGSLTSAFAAVTSVGAVFSSSGSQSSTTVQVSSSSSVPEPVSVVVTSPIPSSSFITSNIATTASSTRSYSSSTSPSSQNVQSTSSSSTSIVAAVSSPIQSTTLSSTIVPQATGGPTINGETDDATGTFLKELKYIYIIAGIILLLILVIVLLLAVVIVMCQRKRFDKQQKKKKHAKQMTTASPRPQPAALTRVVVEENQRQQQERNITPVQSPKRTPKPPTETASKNGSLRRKSDDNSGMSDFPLLCRVLQDYDSTHHKARQNSVSSNEVHSVLQPAASTSEQTRAVNGAAAVHHTISLPLEAIDKEKYSDNVFVPTPIKPVQLVRPVAIPLPHKTTLLSNESEGSISSLPHPLKPAVGIPGNRDSNDYDELEGIAEHKMQRKSMSPPFTNSRTPIGARIPMLPPLTFKPSTFHRPIKPSKIMRNESMRRSQSTNDIFDDPKYTRLSVGSPPNSITNQPIIHEDIYDRLGDGIIPPALPPKQSKEQSQNPIKASLKMNRSFSTLTTGDVSIDSKKKHKDYMSLKQLLEIMETKIPSREASVETDYQDEKFYGGPSVLAPPIQL